jgi:NUDIX domain
MASTVGQGLSRTDLDSVITAGAYVLIDGRFAFMVGPTRQGTSLAVVRLGGHLEEGESPMACAIREVHEEASVRISLISPPATYWFYPDQDPARLLPGLPPVAAVGPTDASEGDSGQVAPVLVVKGSAEQTERLSLMYLANADGEPAPASEAGGLLLLTSEEILRLTCSQVTLNQYMRAGGHARLRDGLPGHLPLEPHLQLRLLALLLMRHPELAGRTSG